MSLNTTGTQFAATVSPYTPVKMVAQISTRESAKHIYSVIYVLGIDNLNRTWGYIIYSSVLNFVSLFLQLFAFTISYRISSSSMSLSTFLTSLQVAINVYAVAIKVILVFLYMPRLRGTDPILKDLDAKIQTEEERALAEYMIKFCNRLVLIYVCSYFGYSTTTFLAALYNGHPPYAIYIPYCHWEDSLTKRIIASFIEYALINVSCLQDVGIDAYAVVFIQMARYHIKILCLRAEALGKDPSKSEEDNIKSLIDCIDAHRKILELVEQVRPIISKTVFVQLIIQAVIMAITLINILMVADFASAIGSFFFLLAVTVETLPLCYTMNVLMGEINSLPTSMFHSAWYYQNKQYRRMILFAIQNAQKFNNIVAGDIMPIQASTFLALTRLSFSIYTMVQQREIRHSAIRGG